MWRRLFAERAVGERSEMPAGASFGQGPMGVALSVEAAECGAVALLAKASAGSAGWAGVEVFAAQAVAVALEAEDL
jgi:hypothetical protein